MKKVNLIRNFLVAAVAVGLIFQQVIAVHAAPGDLDPTFGIMGQLHDADTERRRSRQPERP
jgi:hypothetical protein